MEVEFIEQWNFLEDWYRRRVEEGSVYFPPAILPFLTRLREERWDHRLRPGQSLSSLVLSRSRHHGLRADQPRIGFCFHTQDRGMTVIEYFDGQESTWKTDRIDLTPEVRAALERLAARAVD